MTSYGYIIMIIVDSCMIWFNFYCIMQLKKSYDIGTNICSRKSASTFGDLPDWIGANDLGFTQLPTHKYRGRQLMESILGEPLFITYMNVSGFFPFHVPFWS